MAITPARLRQAAWPGILARCLAAILGGYGLASLVALAGAAWLGPPRSEAVLAGMLLGLLAQAAAALWAFAARSPARAWAGLALPMAALGLALALGGGLP